MINGTGAITHSSAQTAVRSQESGNNLADPEENSTPAPTSDTQATENKQENPLAPETVKGLLAAQEEKESSATGQELTEEEEAIVRELKKTDQEVRAHEQAHKTAGGPYAGAISYQTTTGPDGRQYAVGGEVSIDTSPIPGNPEATIRKMEVVIRAALAPADPSPQDQAVAAQAQQAKVQAQQEAAEQRQEEQEESSNNNGLLSQKQNNTIQDTQTGVKQPPQSDSGDEIVSILFGKSNN